MPEHLLRSNFIITKWDGFLFFFSVRACARMLTCSFVFIVNEMVEFDCVPRKRCEAVLEAIACVSY